VTLVNIRQVQEDIEILLVSMISKPQTELSCFLRQYNEDWFRVLLISIRDISGEGS